MKIFEQNESNVRSYCRSFPEVFHRAKGSILYSEEGKEYIDFFAGAGVLNYGHNNDEIKAKLIEYIQGDGVTHALDMHTSAKRTFIEQFAEKVLKPRGLDYKFQFCGPTGTNAVEAALKIARKAKGRTGIFSFMGGFHGMTLGSLAVTGNKENRDGSGAPLNNVTFMPYPHGFMNTFDTIQYMEEVITDPNSGIEKPAAILLETLQGEGGVVVAPVDWLQRLRKLCDDHDILMICDEIQTGCYRTGTYFSFERAGIVPDIVLLSKSLGGYGLPLSIVLLKSELDIWTPGQHNGTFRGNQMAFVGAVAALEYTEKHNLGQEVEKKEAIFRNFVEKEILPLGSKIERRGLGLMQGIDFSHYGSEFMKTVSTHCFDNGLLVEKAGRGDLVFKLLPPLTIEEEILQKGLSILKEAIQFAFKTCFPNGEK